MKVDKLTQLFEDFSKDEITDLIDRAKVGDTSILDIPNIQKAKLQNGRNPLHYLAEHGEARHELLKHKSVGRGGDIAGRTPLHQMAHYKYIEILDHPLVAKVKDFQGNTPLHLLASQKVKRVLGHPSVDKVKNNNGQTPLDILGQEIKENPYKLLKDWKEGQELKRAVSKPLNKKIVLD